MRKTIRLTMAQALVKFLNQQYIEVDGVESPFVEGIFTIFGHGNVLGLGQALAEERGHLKIYQGKNEQAMAHAAIAFSKEHKRQKIFACTASSGPGSANFVTSAGVALANHIPVLFLPADTFSTRQPDPVLQQLEHEQGISLTTNDSLKAVSRYWDKIERPEQVMSALLRAFEVMTNPATTGPVTLALPQDTQGEAFDYPEEFFKKRVHYLNRPAPTEREMIGAIKLIKESCRPVIIVGGGARYSDAREVLITLAQTCQIPLVETPAGKSTVESPFFYNLGGVGILGTLSANKLIQSADLIIGIGTRYSDFTTCSKTIFDYEKAKFLNINISRFHSYKMEAFSVIADAKKTLETLLPLLENYQSAYGKDLETYKEEWNQEIQRLKKIKFNRQDFIPEIKNQFDQEILNEYADSLNTQLTQTEAIFTLNEKIAKDSIIVSAAGSLPGDLQRLWVSHSPLTYHLEYGYSCMGYEINGALGVKIAHPKQEVYAFVGDGSFNMLHSEFLSSLQYNHKINIILFDNSGFACISNLQMSQGSESFSCEFRNQNNQILNIDYAKIAEGYGAKSWRVHTQEQLEEALKASQKEERSTLIDIKVLPKTMTEGYLAWWNVGVSELSQTEKISQQYREKQKKLLNAKLF